MGSLKLKLAIAGVCGLTAWAYIALTAPSDTRESARTENVDQEQSTVRNFAQYLEKNPQLLNHSESSSQGEGDSTNIDIDSETFQKISHQVLSSNLRSDEEKAFKLLPDGPSKEKIILLTRLLKNDESHLGVSPQEKGLAINYLRKQLEADPLLVRNFVEAAAQIDNDPELKTIHSIYIREAAKNVKGTSPEASLFLTQFQSLNLPDFDPLVREVSNQFPEVREMALRKQQTREIASQPEGMQTEVSQPDTTQEPPAE